MEAIVLGDLELDLVTSIAITEGRKVALHPWPGGDGDLLQDLGMAAAQIRLTGIAYGEEAGSRLEQLRAKLQAGEPIDFAASAAVAANIDQVLITGLQVQQPPGRPQYYEYELQLIRYVQPPSPAPGGFDPDAVADVESQIQADALAAMQDQAGALGTAEGLMNAVDGQLDAAAELLEKAANAAELLSGLALLRKVLGAGGSVVKAASTE